MNQIPLFDHASGTTIDVDQSPVTLRVRAGSAVFAIRGEAWITQEGLADDIILAAGERFDAAVRGTLVISATRGRALLFVARADVARRYRERNVYDFARHRAAELRRAEGARAVDGLYDRFRALVQGARAALAPRRRVPTH